MNSVEIAKKIRTSGLSGRQVCGLQGRLQAIAWMLRIGDWRGVEIGIVEMTRAFSERTGLEWKDDCFPPLEVSENYFGTKSKAKT